MVTLFELKEKMATMQASINADSDWIANKAAEASTSLEEINEKTEHRDGLIKRYELIKNEHDSMEEQQRVSIAMKHGIPDDADAAAIKTKAKANFYKMFLYHSYCFIFL